MKKFLLLLPVIAISAFFLMGANVATAQSSVYSAGDLVKTADRSTVYYFGFDGKRHAFPNEPTYFSWYSNFDGIKIVTPEELANMPLGHNIVVRPGTHLVKIESDPKVYAVEPYGVLRHIPSEQTARELYGTNWAQRVIDVNVAFWPNYNFREAIDAESTVHPVGTVFRYLGDNKTYIYRNCKATPFGDFAQAEAHRYQERFILTLGRPGNTANTAETMYATLATTGSTTVFEYPLGDDVINEIRPVLIDVAQTLVDSNNVCTCPTCGVEDETNPYINLTDNDPIDGEDEMDENPYINLTDNDSVGGNDEMDENPYIDLSGDESTDSNDESDENPYIDLSNDESEPSTENPYANLSDEEESTEESTDETVCDDSSSFVTYETEDEMTSNPYISLSNDEPVYDDTSSFGTFEDESEDNASTQVETSTLVETNTSNDASPTLSTTQLSSPFINLVQ